MSDTCWRFLVWLAFMGTFFFGYFVGAYLAINQGRIFEKAPVYVQQPPGTWTNASTPASYEGLMKWGTTNGEIMTLSLGISFQKDKEQ